MMKKLHGIAAATLVAFAPAARAESLKPLDARPEIFSKVVNCRSITDGAARLACYDENVAALDSAETRRDVVIVNRAQIRETRRSLFGLTLPHLSLFDGAHRDDADREEKEFTTLETVIKYARRGPDGHWIIILEDGARWYQTDSRGPSSDPKPGQKIRIKQAAMGSYLANVNGQIAIRMKREN